MRVRNRLKVTGTVQGVGFRPFVYHLASQNGISGWVLNTSEGVIIEAEGEQEPVISFIRKLSSQAPRLANVADIQIEPREPEGARSFVIRESAAEDGRTALIPADVAMCEACAAEVCDAGNRRFNYPFTNCTDCGPRFTIIRDIPYDRPKTTMSAFSMCPECEQEYHNPGDRRYHAQPNACPACGPGVWLESAQPAVEDGQWSRVTDQTIKRAGELLAQGRIIAIKGLGGFHIACDARNAEAVRELRRRKGRGRKPFALMVRDLGEARRLCLIGPAEESILLSYERPIVLIEAKTGSDLAAEIAPGNRCLGLMLPYTPLHHLLFRTAPPALVMTSANLSEEPIAYRNDEAVSRLFHVADAFLIHNRDIHIGCDDSVVRPVLGEPMLIRRARGFVPNPVDLGSNAPPVLACGGEQKSTICLTVGRWAILSQHIGDLDSVQTFEYYQRAIGHLMKLYDVKPAVVVHDLHPDYLSSRYAQGFEAPRKLPVQHHHAHIASCIAEQQIPVPVIGVAFDGTGFGTDGAIWGGEFLIADLTSFERAAHLRYVPMPGGKAAIDRPDRMALAYLIDAFGAKAEEIAARLLKFSPTELTVIAQQVNQRINAPMTSSVGRLFDSASALLRLCDKPTFEGEAAVALEMCACGDETARYGFEVSADPGRLTVDTRLLVRDLVHDVLSGVAAPAVAARFHNTLTEMVADVCRRIREERGLSRIVLSGGCFQNVRLLESVIRRLDGMGFTVYKHRSVPPNDGGISLGQAAVAAAVCRQESECA